MTPRQKIQQIIREFNAQKVSVTYPDFDWDCDTFEVQFATVWVDDYRDGGAENGNLEVDISLDELSLVYTRLLPNVRARLLRGRREAFLLPMTEHDIGDCYFVSFPLSDKEREGTWKVRLSYVPLAKDTREILAGKEGPDDIRL